MTASGENNQSVSILSALKRAIPERAMAAAAAAAAAAADYVNPSPAVKVFVTGVVFKKSKSQVCNGAGRSFFRGDYKSSSSMSVISLDGDDLIG